MTNIRKVLAILDANATQPGSHSGPALLTIDAEKAFDNVSWEWLNRVLDRMGVLGPFRVYLSSLYADPLARIYTTGYLSAIFPLQKGTRQGCPLSPLLFNLAIEPLSRRLAGALDIRGIQVGNVELKCAQFADDMIFFLAHPVTDVPIVFDYLKSFGLSSGLKVNVSKSELLPLSTGRQTDAANLPPLPVKVSTNYIKYLGIYIGKTPGSIYELNYPHLISKIVKELEGWSRLPLSLLPRCHLLKMISFPKLLYPLQTVPLLLKHKDILKLTSAYLKFVWSGKRPRIAIKKLMLPTVKGGLNLPDLRSYNLASLLRHGADWIKGTSHYSNIEVETALASPWSLTSLLHTKFSSLPKTIRNSLLLKDTIVAWKACRKAFGLLFSLSKHMSFWGHPELPQGRENPLFRVWREKGISGLQHLSHALEGRYLSFPEIQTQFHLPNAHYLAYCQLKGFLKARLQNISQELLPNKFDHLLGPPTAQHSLAILYYGLRRAIVNLGHAEFFGRWNREFPGSDLSEGILEGWRSLRSTILNERWRETTLNSSTTQFMVSISLPTPTVRNV